MFSRQLQASVRRSAQRLAASASLLGVSPNLLTVAGLAMTLAVAVLVALGWLPLAGVGLLLAGGFDILDGAVARAAGRSRPYGAFLDSTLDRYAEGAVYLALLYLFLAHRPHRLEAFLVVAALLGSLLVSYVRARAQSLGFSCDVGWFARPERLVVTALGLLTGQLEIALWVLAVATNLTVLQRVYAVWTQYRDQRREPTAEGEGEDGEAAASAAPPAKPKSRRGAAPSSPPLG